MNVEIRVRCAGILDPDSVTPTTSGGWWINVVSRSTYADETYGDMTTIDFPMEIPASVVGGRMQVTTDTNTILNGLGLGAFPQCAQMEIIGVSIQDSGGNPFAKLGAGTRPKGL